LKEQDLENPRLHCTSDGFKIGTVAVEITCNEISNPISEGVAEKNDNVGSVFYMSEKQ
jgi:hypothetical protein